MCLSLTLVSLTLIFPLSLTLYLSIFFLSFLFLSFSLFLSFFLCDLHLRQEQRQTAADEAWLFSEGTGRQWREGGYQTRARFHARHSPSLIFFGVSRFEQFSDFFLFLLLLPFQQQRLVQADSAWLWQLSNTFLSDKFSDFFTSFFRSIVLKIMPLIWAFIRQRNWKKSNEDILNVLSCKRKQLQAIFIYPISCFQSYSFPQNMHSESLLRFSL